MSDREVDIFAGKIDPMHEGGEFEVDFRVSIGEPPESADQPFGGKVR